MGRTIRDHLLTQSAGTRREGETIEMYEEA